MLGPFVPVETGLAAGHDFIQVATLGDGEVEQGQIKPTTVAAGPDVALGDPAIFIAARLRPEAMQGEVGGFETVLALVPAFDGAGGCLAKGGLPIDGQHVLGAAIGLLRRGRFVSRRQGDIGGAAIDLYPAARRFCTGNDEPKMGGRRVVGGDELMGIAGGEGDTTGIGLAVNRLKSRAGCSCGERTRQWNLCQCR